MSTAKENNNHEQLVDLHLRLEDAKRKASKYLEEKGTTGTEIYSGYYEEEYLQEIQGTEKADLFDMMRRSDAQIQMLLSARKNPILSANWFIEAADSDETSIKQKELIEYELFERCGKPWIDTLEEALSFVDFGFTVFERVNEIVKGDPMFGDYVGLKKLAWRSQRTIEKWNVEKDGTITSVEQEAFGDLESNAIIEGKDLIVMSLRKIGDNYEGISALRPIYGNWLRKKTFLKLLAIGIERYAVGTPVGTIPAGKEQSPEKQIFESILARFTSHEKSFITKTQGWEIDFLKSEFSADKVKEVILYEDLQMAKSFVATHLELGTGGNGGAYALGSDLSDQFLSIIQNDADIVARSINNSVIKELIDLNFGKQAKYPKLRVTGINDKLGKESADIFKTLAESKMITPNKSIEVFLRKEFDLPSLSEQELEEIENFRQPAEQPGAPTLLSEQTIQLADKRDLQSKINKQINKSSAELKEFIQTEQKKRVETAIKAFGAKLQSTPRGKWPSLAFEYKLPAVAKYAKGMRELMAEHSRQSLDQVAMEAPASKRITLDEKDLKGLPKVLRDYLLIESQAIALTQDSDLVSSAVFTFTGSIDEGTDVNIILDDMKQAQDKAIEGRMSSLGGANAATKILNKSRFEYFQSPEVLNEIQAFEFLNSDPKTDICRDLKGRIFRKDDPRSQQYLPPLHHNCKSFIAAIYDSIDSNKITDLKPTRSSFEKQITLKETIDPYGNNA